MPDELKPPYLPAYFKEVLDFYEKVKTQWVVSTGLNGAVLIGLNYVAVYKTAKLYHFRLDDFKMDILRQIENFMIRQNNE